MSHTVRTDVVFMAMTNQYSPALHWQVWFSTDPVGALPFERVYEFTCKPTRKQIRKARKHFKISYDMYENYY